MKKNVLMVGVAAIVGLATFTLLPAQEPSPGGYGKQKSFTGYVNISTPVNGNPVTGAPYAADAVTETTQTLGDGNRIERTSSVKIYRDGQGRERQEEGGSDSRILISDPVAKTSFTLDPKAHTAQKSANLLLIQLSDFEVARAGVLTATQVGYANIGGGVRLVPLGTALVSSEPATEQLSPKTIEGVFANGTRATVTIPAGQIGNERPIQVIDEVWYSPDLQMNVMTKHSDPRTGEVVYQLKNISRGEPDASLFQVPADYKITEGGGRGRGRGGVAP